ncbi:MAG: 2-C-methyl-D-erythritol 4-phosphate cytidylyltransferase [Burkholderiaceae bacterium]
MTRRNSTEFIALVPAGGTGSRVGGDKPKQYLPIQGEPMIVRTISSLLACAWMTHVYVVVAANDPHQHLVTDLQEDRCTVLPVAGASRRDTVLAGLDAINAVQAEKIARTNATSKPGEVRASPPWVMVHDAARPGISIELLERLRDCVVAQTDSDRPSGPSGPSGSNDHPLGALLALPVADTIKRAAPAQGDPFLRVGQTVDRSGLWAAQTPQVFPLDLLRIALAEYELATDEASAVERLGYAPALVPGHWHNLKVTTAEDLTLMGQVFQSRA